MAEKHDHGEQRGKMFSALIFAVFLVLICVVAVRCAVGTGGHSAVQPEPMPSAGRFSDEDFSIINGRMHYTGAFRQGIDVSVHQGQIDWAAVAEDGISFAFIRAGYRGTTEGGLFQDEAFADNVSGAQRVGIETGAYFFSQATSVDEALQEAEMMLELLDGRSMTYPVVYDWEVAAEGRTADVRYDTVTACAKAFCQRIEEAGYRAGVYFNLEMAKYMDTEELSDYVLWLADYSPSPGFDGGLTFWQYSCQGSVSGISGDTDLNLMFLNSENNRPA